MSTDQGNSSAEGCSNCGHASLIRSHTRWHERARRWLTLKRPYRCTTCNWRGWRYPAHETDDGRAVDIGRRARLQRRLLTWAAMTAAVLAIGLPYTRQHRPPAVANPDRGSTADSLPQSAPQLSLESSHVYLNSNGDYWTVEGSIKNLTSETLTNLHVAFTWLDSRSQVVDSRVDLVDLKRIAPGEVSTFRSATPARPEITRLRLAFESELGALLLAVDALTVTAPQ